jgi:hypothetical protein
MGKQLFKYGIKHEIAIRWPLWDLKYSNQVAKKIDFEIADQIIIGLLNQGKPALIGRLGGTEARFLKEFKKIRSSKYSSNILFRTKPSWRKRSEQINSLAGFYFDNRDQVEEFFNLYQQAMFKTDVFGAWGTTFASIEFELIDKIKHFIPKEFSAPWVRPYSRNQLNIPWSKGLQGKKVLVISHFVDTIEKQFAKIERVFPGLNCHDFQLITLKSPFTANTKNLAVKSWSMNLVEIQNQMRFIDFDVALISAGSYSYPLAHFSKEIGKIGIHAGGGLQLFFGIMGKRWEKSEYYYNQINTEWCRPSELEKPTDIDRIEGGAYW